MHCSNCGTKIEEGVAFCQSCGTNTKDEKPLAKSHFQNPTGEILYYGQDWIRAKHFAIASLPYHDILATKDRFYILQFPKSSGGTWGLIIGLLLFNIIGAAIGAAIGNSSDRKKRQKARDTWLVDNGLISDNYKKYIFAEISKDKLKKHISFEKDKYIAVSGGEKMVKLKKSKKEFANFKTFIESYVL
ncbi:zinc ribbon domain-containing protein [Patescibacteria group bacterium]|nr:zinc ribbon domain-containing protein [Patescibacteria group bacterium]